MQEGERREKLIFIHDCYSLSGARYNVRNANLSSDVLGARRSVYERKFEFIRTSQNDDPTCCLSHSKLPDWSVR